MGLVSLNMSPDTSRRALSRLYGIIYKRERGDGYDTVAGTAINNARLRCLVARGLRQLEGPRIRLNTKYEYNARIRITDVIYAAIGGKCAGFAWSQL